MVTILMVVAFGDADEDPPPLFEVTYFHGHRSASNLSAPVLPPPTSHEAIFSHLTDDAYRKFQRNSIKIKKLQAN